MNLVGFYSLTVNIWNFFGAETKVNLIVEFHYHPCYFEVVKEKQKAGFKVEAGLTPTIKLQIPPGGSLAFPMYFGDEYLCLSLEHGSQPSYPYQVIAGNTAECFPHKLGEPVYGTPYKSRYGYCWMGGAWEITANNTPWEMTIRKTIRDPQSDDVTVGPGRPG